MSFTFPISLSLFVLMSYVALSNRTEKSTPSYNSNFPPSSMHQESFVCMCSIVTVYMTTQHCFYYLLCQFYLRAIDLFVVCFCWFVMAVVSCALCRRFRKSLVAASDCDKSIYIRFWKYYHVIWQLYLCVFKGFIISNKLVWINITWIVDDLFFW